MSFERVISNRPVEVPFKIPGSDEVQWFQFTPGVVEKVPTDVFASMRARGETVDNFISAGILRIVKSDRAEPIMPAKPPAQELAEAIGRGEKVVGALVDQQVEVQPKGFKSLRK